MTVETGVRAPRARASGEGGFSLIETLIAALLLLMIVVGILPLFSRAMLNNISGNDASNVANGAIDEFEGLFPLPFDNQRLTVPAGVTEVVVRDFYSLQLNRWVPAITAPDTAQYERQLRIQQFSFPDIDDDGDLDTPLDGGTDPANVQFKLFDVEVQNNRTLGAPLYRVRALQSF